MGDYHTYIDEKQKLIGKGLYGAELEEAIKRRRVGSVTLHPVHVTTRKLVKFAKFKFFAASVAFRNYKRRVALNRPPRELKNAV